MGLPRFSGGGPKPGAGQLIKAILFDFGQTLVDSADGFRQAEKDTQAAIFQVLAITDHDAFKHHYRRIRAEFHKKVPAGATVRIEGTVRRMRGRLGSLKLKAFLGDVLAAEGVMGFAL